LARRKKLINNSGIPQHEIEYIAQCILPDIIALYESEEGQREFQEWKALHLFIPCISTNNVIILSKVYVKLAPNKLNKENEITSIYRIFCL